MSSGVPVIATKAGVFEEMVLPSKTGYIVEYEDIDNNETRFRFIKQ